VHYVEHPAPSSTKLPLIIRNPKLDAELAACTGLGPATRASLPTACEMHCCKSSHTIPCSLRAHSLASSGFLPRTNASHTTVRGSSKALLTSTRILRPYSNTVCFPCLTSPLVILIVASCLGSKKSWPTNCGKIYGKLYFTAFSTTACLARNTTACAYTTACTVALNSGLLLVCQRPFTFQESLQRCA
jgi:hypothetical protein